MFKYCGNCGSKFAPYPDTPPISQFPIRCGTCDQVTYKPIPTVVVLIVPLRAMTFPVLAVRRIDPGNTDGKLALPGGYQLSGETWQATGAREVREETGVEIDPATITLVSMTTVENGSLNLIIGVCLAIEPPEMLVPDRVEVSEIVVLDKPTELAFPAHTEALACFFDVR